MNSECEKTNLSGNIVQLTKSFLKKRSIPCVQVKKNKNLIQTHFKFIHTRLTYVCLINDELLLIIKQK